MQSIAQKMLFAKLEYFANHNHKKLFVMWTGMWAFLPGDTGLHGGVLQIA